MLANLHTRYNRKVVEQAAIAGVLTPSVFDNPENAQAAAAYIARRLDALADETERGWQGVFQDGFRFERTVRGVKEVAFIDQALLASADARKLDEHAAALQATARRLNGGFAEMTPAERDDPHHQQPGADQPGDPPANPRGGHLPE